MTDHHHYPRQTHHNPALREAQAQWIAHLQQTETYNTFSRDMKSPEQHTKQPNQGNKPYHTKASPKNKRKHANRRRQMFFNSSNQPPTPVPTRNPPSLATPHLQSKTSQQNHQNESKSKTKGAEENSGKTIFNIKSPRFHQSQNCHRVPYAVPYPKPKPITVIF
jgi:hypothetical protein